jgi:hypothetical protein
MKALGAIIVLLYSVGPAAAIDCQSKAGRDGHWTWREIDGRRCWYRGEVKISKDQLRWAPGQAFDPNPYGDPIWDRRK